MIEGMVIAIQANRIRTRRNLSEMFMVFSRLHGLGCYLKWDTLPCLRSLAEAVDAFFRLRGLTE